jgi:nitrite reductase/ring-hydroxylating ferredoxin subunit
MAEVVELCGEDEISEGEAKRFLVDDRRVLLVQVGGELYALDGTCTHEDADLSLGFLAGERITCPLHLSIFDIKTGEVQSAPATEDLDTYDVEVVDGKIRVTLN